MVKRLALSFLIGLGCLAAQSTRAELFGSVLDPSGLPVRAAELTLRNTATGLQSSYNTGADGLFRFASQPPGLYSLRVVASGFRPLERSQINLTVGSQIALDLTLQLGDSAQSVEVTAEAPLLESTRGSASYSVDQRKIVTLPLDGRNFIPLIALSPGVSLPPASTLPRINGSRPRVSEYLYDGISVLQPEPGQVAYFPIIDAMEEFRVEINSYSAEYGRANGGIIMVNQKSGGNQYHGTLFEFLRNQSLNARNFFAAAGPKPAFQRNQYGFVFGGPIVKNKTFFFLDWQGTRLRTGVTRFSTVPTAAQRQGIFSAPIYDPASGRRDLFPANTVPATRWDRAAANLLTRYPMPNNGTGSANNFVRAGNESTNQDQFDTRLDHYFSPRHRLFGRYAYLRDDSAPLTPLPDGSGNLTSGVIGNTLTRADSVVAEHTWTFDPTRSNQLRFGYTRRGFDRASLAGAARPEGLGPIPTASFSSVFPSFDVNGYQLLGPPQNGNAKFTTSVTQIIDSFTWLRGRHSIKAGFDFRHERLDVLQPPSPTGLFQFTNILTSGLTATGGAQAGTGNSLASFLLGAVQSFQIDAQQTTIKPRANIAEFYLQDDFRLNARLSLNAGIRYTLNFPSTVVNNQGAVFNLNTQKLDYLGQNGFSRAARNLEFGNFGPRLGLAYKVNDRLVIRAGYGITWIEQAGITTPFTTPLFPFIQTLQQQSLDNIAPAFALSRGPGISLTAPNPDSGLGQGVFGVQRDQKSGYAQQWNLTIQKTFANNWSLAVGYLGSKLTNLGVPDVNLNQLRVEQLALGSQLTQNVPNPYFGQIPISSSLGRTTIAAQQLLRPYPRFNTVTLYRNNVGHSTYHSLQVKLERRFSRGLTLQAAYTYSRLIDDAGAVFDSAILTGPVTAYQAADSFNRRLEKDVSTGNIPHNFSTGIVYELPGPKTGWRKQALGGWQLAAIVRAQAGSPLAVTQATNSNAFAGFGIQRPNRLRSPDLASDVRSSARWFDTTAFTLAPQFTIGNSSRNPVIGPPYRAADLMLGKTFSYRERYRLEYRAEAFNLTNTPNFGNPNTSFGNAAFGTINSAFDPRVFEMVLKLHF